MQVQNILGHWVDPKMCWFEIFKVCEHKKSKSYPLRALVGFIKHFVKGFVNFGGEAS
jgi:hypothetical protein